MLSSIEILYAYFKLMNYLCTKKFYVRNVMHSCKDFSRLVNFGFYMELLSSMGSGAPDVYIK